MKYVWTLSTSAIPEKWNVFFLSDNKVERQGNLSTYCAQEQHHGGSTSSLAYYVIPVSRSTKK